jgi:hypothetical protein
VAEVNPVVMVHPKNWMILKCGHLQNFAPGEMSNNQPQDFVAVLEGQLKIGLCAIHRVRSVGFEIRLTVKILFIYFEFET